MDFLFNAVIMPVFTHFQRYANLSAYFGLVIEPVEFIPQKGQ